MVECRLQCFSHISQTQKTMCMAGCRLANASLTHSTCGVPAHSTGHFEHPLPHLVLAVQPEVESCSPRLRRWQARLPWRRPRSRSGGIQPRVRQATGWATRRSCTLRPITRTTARLRQAAAGEWRHARAGPTRELPVQQRCWAVRAAPLHGAAAAGSGRQAGTITGQQQRAACPGLQLQAGACMRGSCNTHIRASALHGWQRLTGPSLCPLGDIYSRHMRTFHVLACA